MSVTSSGIDTPISAHALAWTRSQPPPLVRVVAERHMCATPSDSGVSDSRPRRSGLAASTDSRTPNAELVEERMHETVHTGSFLPCWNTDRNAGAVPKVALFSPPAAACSPADTAVKLYVRAVISEGPAPRCTCARS